MRNFRSLNIWKEGITLVKRIYKLVEILPNEEKYGLKSQICRAAVSIPSNIAEGCSRSSEIEFKRFLEIAIGSAFELETQLIIIDELEFVPKEHLNPIFELLNNEQKMINGLISKIKRATKG
jgi:four helix bundle protein